MIIIVTKMIVIVYVSCVCLPCFLQHVLYPPLLQSCNLRDCSNMCAFYSTRAHHFMSGAKAEFLSLCRLCLLFHRFVSANLCACICVCVSAHEPITLFVNSTSSSAFECYDGHSEGLI